MGIPAFWASLFPKREGAHIRCEIGLQTRSQGLCRRDKNPANEADCPKKKEEEEEKKLFSQFQEEPLLGLKFPPYFLSDAKQVV